MMKNKFLIYFLLIFIQVFVLNKMLFFNYVIVSPFLLLLILFSYKKDSKRNLFWAFVLGGVVDIFNDSLGVYTTVGLIIGFFRNYWVIKVIGEEKTEELNMLSVHEIGKFQFFNYSFPIILIYFSMLFYLESNTIFSLNSIITILLTSIFNYMFMLLFQYLFLKSNFKNEWR
tara:strand:+ start:34 stop:549 length:516 start_codon:yes stop_codon:yes gene_type:complete